MKKILIAIAVALGMIAAAPVASAADYGSIAITADASVCGQVTLTVTNSTPHAYSGDWRVPGDTGEPDEYSDIVVDEGPLAGQPLGPRFVPFPVPAGESTTVIELDEDQPVTSIEYRVARGPEQLAFLDWTPVGGVATDCEDDPVVDEPPADDPGDTNDGTDDGTDTGTDDGTDDDVNQGSDTGTDDPTDTSDQSAVDTATDTTLDEAGSVVEAADTQELAETGVSDVLPYLLVGGVVLAAGGVGVVLAARRRRTNK